MSSTYLDLGLRVAGREIFTTTEAPAAANEAARTLSTGQHSFQKTLGPSTTPALTKPLVSREITLTSAVITTVDLAAIAALALPAGATRTVDLTGAKVVAILIRTKNTNNAAGVNIAPGAANPYPLFGTGNDITLLPDCELVMAFRETASALPAVAAAVKEIDLTGTTGDVVWLEIYAGT